MTRLAFSWKALQLTWHSAFQLVLIAFWHWNLGASATVGGLCHAAERPVRWAAESTMWTSRIDNSERTGSIRVTLVRSGAVAAYQDVIDSWQSDPAFCGWFNDLLAAAPFSAFRWETPPVTAEISDRPFEFVLLDSPGLARAPQQSAFAEHFRAYPGSDVLTFKNLGGDAIMVVPRPLAPDEAYGHLGAFVRRAPEEQRRRLWKHVADAMAGRVSAKPVWLSTAGGGVAWLHVRLDDTPKYYAFAAYRTPPERARP